MTRQRAGGLRRWAGLKLWAGAGLTALALGACAPTIVNSGYVMDDDAIQQIQPGVQSREQVAQMLGSPSTVAAFDDQTWLYIHRRTSQRAFFDPNTLEQDVVAITFDRGSGKVTEVRRLTLADGQAIEPVDRVTPSPGKELSLMEQFLGNLGRFNNSNTRAPR